MGLMAGKTGMEKGEENITKLSRGRRKEEREEGRSENRRRKGSPPQIIYDSTLKYYFVPNTRM